MKSLKPLLTLILFINVFIVHGQNNVTNQDADKNNSKIFKINPIGQDKIPQKLRFRKWFKFEISNINTIKLNGYTSSTPFTFETVAPPIFSDTKIQTPETDIKPDKTNKPSDSVINFLERSESIAAPNNKKAKKPNQPDVKLLNDFETYYNKFIDKYHLLQRCTVAEDTLYKMLPDVIIRNVDGLKSNTQNYMANLYNVPADLKPEELGQKLADKLNQTLMGFNQDYITLKGAYEAINGTAVSDNSDITGTLKNNTGSITVSVDKATATIIPDPKFLTEFNNATKIFNSLNLDDSQARLFNKAFKGIMLYNIIQKENFITDTDPEQLNDDETDVAPVLKNSKGVVVKEFNKVNVKAYGGLKVNFTTGYLLTFRGDDNYSYYNTGNPAAIAGVVKQKSNGLINSIGALAHVYPRTATGFSPGLSGGFSLTNNGNIGFYLGGSGLFLEKNRLALTAGISYVRVNVLNTGNLNAVNDQPGKYTFNSTETKINYDPLYKPGFFIGITYNIFTDSSTKSATAK